MGLHIVMNQIHRLRGFAIAFVALALSASLAFGAQPTTTGLANAATHAGKTVPVLTGDETTEETTDETTDETPESDTSDGSDNCTTDPSTLTPEQLAATRHGSIVCWAAQQTTWPEWFANHGAFVSCWAHQGKKADAPSCTTDPTAGAPAAEGATPGHGNGKGKNKQK